MTFTEMRFEPNQLFGPDDVLDAGLWDKASIANWSLGVSFALGARL